VPARCRQSRQCPAPGRARRRGGGRPCRISPNHVFQRNLGAEYGGVEPAGELRNAEFAKTIGRQNASAWLDRDVCLTKRCACACIDDPSLRLSRGTEECRPPRERGMRLRRASGL
jgi:hypothetical protein